jgi:transposase
MSKKEVVPNRQYTNEFKVDVVRLAESVGGNEAAKRRGIPDSSLWNWVRLSRARKLRSSDGAAAIPTAKTLSGRGRGGERVVAPGTGEHQARSGNRKKAAAYFAKESR